MTTPEEREEWKRLEAEATEGPWKVWAGANTEEHHSALFAISELDKILEARDLGEDFEIEAAAQADAAFIAAARNALPRLIAQVEELTKCFLCDGTGTIYEDHGGGLMEPLGCDGCMGSGIIDPQEVIRSLMRSLKEEQRRATKEWGAARKLATKVEDLEGKLKAVREIAMDHLDIDVAWANQVMEVIDGRG